MSTPFRKAVRQALANPVLQEALDNNAQRRRTGARRANATLPDLEAVRQRARAIREAVLRDWDGMLSAFSDACQANGVVLLRAASAEEACDQVLDIARRHAVRLVAKSKSMVTEEIHLNAALEKAGLEVVETDLGEYIVQLRGEPPAHIITPALHLRRQEVGRTFADRFGMPYTEDVSEMTAVARRNLRQVFLTADMGISGVNLASADTGTLCLVTNEGNGRMVTTLPRVHVALLGAERLVPTLEDMGVVLQLLPRNATGQILTSYITLIQRPGDPRLWRRLPPSICDPRRQRTARSAGHASRRSAAVHPLRRLPEQLSGLPGAWRTRVPKPIPGADRIGGFARAVWHRTFRPSCEGFQPVRRLQGGLSDRHRHPSHAPARPPGIRRRRVGTQGFPPGLERFRVGWHPPILIRHRPASGRNPHPLSGAPHGLAALASTACRWLNSVTPLSSICRTHLAAHMAQHAITEREFHARPPG